MTGAIVIKEVLQEVFHDIEGGRRDREGAIISAWKAAVGPRVAARTRVLATRHRALVIGVDNAPLLYWLSLYKQRILKKMEAASPLVRAEGLTQIQLKTIGS